MPSRWHNSRRFVKRRGVSWTKGSRRANCAIAIPKNWRVCCSSSTTVLCWGGRCTGRVRSTGGYVAKWRPFLGLTGRNRPFESGVTGGKENARHLDENRGTLRLRLLLLYRLRMCESGRKVQTCGLFLCPEAARNSVEGFGVEAPDSLIIENAHLPGWAGSKV